MNKIKEHPLLLISSIISMTLGMWLITTDYNKIIGLLYFIVGGGLILTGISKILINNKPNDKLYLYDGTVDIIVGILIMFVHDIISTIILGALFIVFPIIRIMKSADKNNAVKKELPLLIIGLVIALSGDLIGNIFVKILGGLFICLAIYLFINIFTDKISINRSTKRVNHPVDRDNVIDGEYEE